MADISFSDLTARLDAINGSALHTKISNFSCIDEKGMKLECGRGFCLWRTENGKMKKKLKDNIQGAAE